MNRTLFSASIRLDADRFVRPLRTAKTEMGAFSQAADRASARYGASTARMGAQSMVMGAGVSRGMRLATFAANRFERGLGFLERRVLGLARTLKYSVLFGTFGLSAMFTGGVAAGLKFNATFEDATRSFEVFLGTEKRAKRFIETLRSVSKASPFRLTDFMGNARQLLSVGFDEKKIPRLLTATGNAVAAFGGGPQEMEQVIRALSQIQAKGKVSAEEIMQLNEAGLSVGTILRKELKLTGEELGDIGNQGISAQRGLDAITKGLEARFAGAGVKFRQTYTGKIAVLRKDIEQLLRVSTSSLFATIRDDALPAMQRVTQDLVKIFDAPGAFGTKLRNAWEYINVSFDQWLDGGGLESIEKGGGKIGEIIAGAINTVFGIGAGDGKKSPFYRAGEGAIKGFAKGFTNSLGTGEILTSPLGRILEGYFLLKFGPRLLKRLSRSLAGASLATGAGGGLAEGFAEDARGSLAAKAIEGSRVYWKTPMPVYVIGGGGGPGMAPGPGGSGKPGGGVILGPNGKPIPRPGGGGIPPVAAGAGKWSRVAGAGKNIGRIGAAGALRAGPWVGAIMAFDALTREDHNPFGSAVDIGEMGGYGLRNLFGMDEEREKKDKRTKAYNRLFNSKRAKREGRTMVDPVTGRYVTPQALLNAKRPTGPEVPPPRMLENTAAWFSGKPNRANAGLGHARLNEVGADSPLKGLVPDHKLMSDVTRKNAEGAQKANEKTVKQVLTGVPLMKEAGKAQGLAVTAGLVSPAVMAKAREGANSVKQMIAASLGGPILEGPGMTPTTPNQGGPLRFGPGGMPQGSGPPIPQIGAGSPAPGEGTSHAYAAGQAMGMNAIGSLMPRAAEEYWSRARSANNGKVIGVPYSGTHTLGNWQSDNAVDIAMAVGSPVGAWLPGTVTGISGQGGSDISSRYAGLGITVAGPGGAIFYKHLLSSGLSVGDKVAAGQAIGASGGGNGVAHIHAGFQPPLSPKQFVSYHGGGRFQAKGAGGEGLALLRDGEEVLPTGESRGRSRARRVVDLNLNVSVSGSTGGADIDELAHRIGVSVAEAIDNMSLVSVED